MSAVEFAVLDTETTGLHPGYHHRIAEIAIVHADASGSVTGEWSTLVNPERDLGPQAIHGIRAAEVRRAPRFADIAGEVIERLRGRVVVAHNWPFDARHLHAEFARIGIDSPLHAHAGLCTLQASARALPRSGRSLIECCTTAGLPELTTLTWHTAHDDARAAAALLRFLLHTAPATAQVTAEQARTSRWAWPSLPLGIAATVQRTPVGHVEPHFLARLVERLPRDEEPAVDAYLALLDNALLDRHISASEADALLDLAHELALHTSEALAVHHGYLRELARAAWADGVVTDAERHDLATVAIVLGLDPSTVDTVLDEEHATGRGDGTPPAPAVATPGGLTLRPGDKIVLTGDMRLPRAEIAAMATVAGLRVTTAVSRKTRVLVAADPDSLSRKGAVARDLGIPIVTEDAFLRTLEALLPAA